MDPAAHIPHIIMAIKAIAEATQKATIEAEIVTADEIIIAEMTTDAMTTIAETTIEEMIITAMAVITTTIADRTQVAEIIEITAATTISAPIMKNAQTKWAGRYMISALSTKNAPIC